MGSRAAVIIVNEDGSVEQFFDRSAAQTLAQDAALSGFDATLTRVRRMRRVNGESREWAGPLCEGSILIDIPARRLVWAEEGEGLILPRIMNRLLERTWHGWSAIWSPEGIDGITHLAGGDPEPIDRSISSESAIPLANMLWFAPCLEQVGYAVLSARLEDGALVIWRSDACHNDLAQLDPKEVIRFARTAHRESRRGDGWGIDWWLSESSSGFPEEGVHFDVPTRTLSWWSISEEDTSEDAFRARWPDWTIRSVGDAHEWHQQQLSSAPMQQSWLVHVVKTQQHYERVIAQRYRDNPQFGSLGDETGIEHEWTVFDELDRLMDGPPLAPACYVDRHGVFHEPAQIL